MPVKLVIFDLDGTIINAYPAIIESVNITLRRLGIAQKKAFTIKRAVGWGDRNLFKPFVPAGVLDKAVRIYRAHHQGSLIRKSALISGSKELLSFLSKSGVKLAVASNRPTKFSLILLRHLGLKKYFDYILCADKLKNGKPDPQILNKIARKLCINKKDVLYVGDMALDAETGRRAKIRTISVLGGSSSKDEIAREKPFKVAENLGAVLKIIRRCIKAG